MAGKKPQDANTDVDFDEFFDLESYSQSTPKISLDTPEVAGGVDGVGDTPSGSRPDHTAPFLSSNVIHAKDFDSSGLKNPADSTTFSSSLSPDWAISATEANDPTVFNTPSVRSENLSKPERVPKRFHRRAGRSSAPSTSGGSRDRIGEPYSVPQIKNSGQVSPPTPSSRSWTVHPETQSIVYFQHWRDDLNMSTPPADAHQVTKGTLNTRLRLISCLKCSSYPRLPISPIVYEHCQAIARSKSRPQKTSEVPLFSLATFHSFSPNSCALPLLTPFCPF